MILFTFLGTVFLGVGLVGVVIPVLPTTPFLLLAAACYGNTPKLQSKIKNMPFFKEYFKSYEDKTGIPTKTLIISLLFLWSSILISMLLMDSPHIKIFLVFIVVAVTLHLLWMSKPVRDIRKQRETSSNQKGNNKKNPFSNIELIFDIVYLISGLCISIIILIKSSSLLYTLAGIMGLILISGDSFHLIPRIAAILTGIENIKRLGIGKFVTSITMTVFYVLLYYIGVIAYSLEPKSILTVVIWILAIIRIFFCFLPQNKWTEKNASNTWNILRNIPFTLMGILIANVFFQNRFAIPSLQFLWIAILLSFLFYLPVVIWGNKKPMLGALMLPKSCVYIWILTMFLT